MRMPCDKKYVLRDLLKLSQSGSFVSHWNYTKGMDTFIKQTLLVSYINRARLGQLLVRLFGIGNFRIEVSTLLS
jgi:hypothetical protein